MYDIFKNMERLHEDGDEKKQPRKLGGEVMAGEGIFDVRRGIKIEEGQKGTIKSLGKTPNKDYMVEFEVGGKKILMALDENELQQ